MFYLGKYGTIIAYVLLFIYCMINLFPLFLIFMNSFKTMRDIFLKPFSFLITPSFQNYLDAWNQGSLGTGFLNSALIGAISVIVVVLISSMFAYAISRYEFPGRQTLYMYCIFGLALPLRLAVIPIYNLMQGLGLTNSRLGLIIFYIAVNIAFSVFLLKNFIDEIPKEIEEAAIIDGANSFQIYWGIILPLIKPILSIVSIVCFTNVWNDFFFPLVLINDKSKVTMTLAVTIFFGEYTTKWDLLFAGLSLAMMPSIVIFLLFSKQFIAGMTQGAIK